MGAVAAVPNPRLVASKPNNGDCGHVSLALLQKSFVLHLLVPRLDDTSGLKSSVQLATIAQLHFVHLWSPLTSFGCQLEMHIAGITA